MSVVIKVGEDFEEDFCRELEDCTTCRSNGGDRNQSTHSHWSGIVESVDVSDGGPRSFAFV